MDGLTKQKDRLVRRGRPAPQLAKQRTSFRGAKHRKKEQSPKWLRHHFQSLRFALDLKKIEPHPVECLTPIDIKMALPPNPRRMRLDLCTRLGNGPPCPNRFERKTEKARGVPRPPRGARDKAAASGEAVGVTLDVCRGDLGDSSSQGGSSCGALLLMASGLSPVWLSFYPVPSPKDTSRSAQIGEGTPG